MQKHTTAWSGGLTARIFLSVHTNSPHTLHAHTHYRVVGRFDGQDLYTHAHTHTLPRGRIYLSVHTHTLHTHTTAWSGGLTARIHLSVHSLHAHTRTHTGYRVVGRFDGQDLGEVLPEGPDQAHRHRRPAAPPPPSNWSNRCAQPRQKGGSRSSCRAQQQNKSDWSNFCA